MVEVNHHNLRWARDTAKLSRDDAAKKLNLTTSKRSTAVEKLDKIENGDKPPTQSQLEKMANVYKQPVVAFYLDSQPSKGDILPDFRTLPQQKQDPEGSARLDILISEVKARQSLTRDLLEEEGQEPLAHVASAKDFTDAEYIAADIKKTMGFELDQYRRTPSQPEKAFKYLRSCIENVGIFVLLISDLGHPQSNTIPVSVFRGFALADSIAPYIVINRKDSKRAQSFTLLHEVAHIWLGSSGISGKIHDTDSNLERLCSRVAARMLLQPHELTELSSLRSVPLENQLSIIQQFADYRNISQPMVAYNLRLEDYIDSAMWQRLQDKYAEDLLDKEQKEKEKREQDKALGKSTPIDPNKVKRSSLGAPLLDLARRSLATDILTPTKASILLGVNPRKVRSFLYPNRQGRSI
ncbi:MAG: XRE family transcriptional regulator [Chloroflexi bacterium]|nr:XRE family transcriptional regulator [Chloroflexota bacterium]